MARIQPRGWGCSGGCSGAIYRAGAQPPAPRPAPTTCGPDPGGGGPVAPRALALTHIPPPAAAAHTLSRLCAWVRGDSSCSTRRSWGAARESIAATPRPQTQRAPSDPQTGSGRRGPAVLGGLPRGKCLETLSWAPFQGHRGRGREARRGPAGAPPTPAAARAIPPPLRTRPETRGVATAAPRRSRTGGGAARSRPARRRRETVAWKWGRGRSHRRLLRGAAGHAARPGGGPRPEPHGLSPGAGAAGEGGGSGEGR